MTSATDFDLLFLDLVKDEMAAGGVVTIFTSGVLRGRVESIEVRDVAPPVQWAQPGVGVEPCVIIVFTPPPRDPSKVREPKTYKFSRKKQSVHFPARLANRMVNMAHVSDVFILNLDSSVR